MSTTLDNSSNTGLNKLLPKSISSKRLRRKQDREQPGLSYDDASVFAHSQSSRETLESDGTRSGHIAGDEDEGTSQSHRSYESDGDESEGWQIKAPHDAMIAHTRADKLHNSIVCHCTLPSYLSYNVAAFLLRFVSGHSRAQQAWHICRPPRVHFPSKLHLSVSNSRYPPPFSTHPSQIGHLTTNSSIVQAKYQPESQPSLSDVESNSSASKSSTFPASRTDSIDSKDPRIGRSKTGLLPPQSSARRSPSPAGRLKGIFKPKKSSGNNSSPERRPASEPQPSSETRDEQQPTISVDPDPDQDLPVLEPPAAAKVASPERRTRVQPKVDTNIPPRTPPSGDKPAPVIVNTPPTPTEFANKSGQSSPERKSFWSSPGNNSGTNGRPSSQNMSANRRSRSNSQNIGPSKLSNIVSAPLTPTQESDEPTPTVNQNPSGGFFSSMISAAQSAANSFSNTSLNLGGNKSRSVTPNIQETPESDDTQDNIEPAPVAQMADKKENRKSAVSTIGAGELSLSQLGLAEAPSLVASPVNARFPDVSDTRARSESAPVDSPVSPVEFIPEESSSRPRSLYEPVSRERTPPPPELTNKENGVQRTSSLRSALKQSHRKRGSSVTTGTTIGAAIAAANNSLAHPNLSAPKLTGFAIASKKRNRDFHDLFKSVPDDDYLIEDYSCALQREILAHGRLYVSEGHLCFSSNIFGWTTTLVMSFDEIVSVEKRSTALLFKNGLMISTLHAKHIFASFTSRDATYDLIVNIWKLGHPTLKSTLNGVRLEGTGGDKTEKVDAEPPVEEDETHEGSETDDESDDEEEYYDEDVHEEMHNASIAAETKTNGADADGEKAASRKASGAALPSGPASEESPPAAGGSADFPGPAAHAPTECGDTASHYDRVVGDDIIPAPLGKVYNLMFGPASVTFMSNWLSGEQKCLELQMEDKKGLTLDNRTRTFSYIKPLYGSIGPKQTKTITSETLETLDLEKSVNLTCSTQTPDVPSGNVFAVKTRYCLSWAENNATRVQMNCTIEWSGKSWLKGPIEKGATDGQTTYGKDLFAAIKAAVSSKPGGATPVAPALKGGKRKGKKAKLSQSNTGVVETSVAPKRPAQTSWGVLEPVRGILEPIGDIIQPLLTGNVMYGLLVGLLVATWFGFGFTPSRNVSYGRELEGVYRPDRIAAYEEMWRREDTELWDWLEERVGMDRLQSENAEIRKRAMEPKTVEENLRATRMGEKEVEEAIRVTEEKLRVLKGVMEKKSKPGRSTGEDVRSQGV
ncbi:GRAM domain-containing protein 2 [Fusarium fujikuroi]|nr:GRAM domain-containing protein 2 [Fusarium fujikuroi]